MRILAIDPGNVESAFVIYDPRDGSIGRFGKLQNEQLLSQLSGVVLSQLSGVVGFDVLVVERVACMGMAVGESIFETVFWSGRFVEKFGGRWDRVKRHEVKMHLCGSMRAKDGNIRQALIDRFGAPGTKKNPGKLYGVSGDVWAALAVAVTYADKLQEK